MNTNHDHGYPISIKRLADDQHQAYLLLWWKQKLNKKLLWKCRELKERNRLWLVICQVTNLKWSIIKIQTRSVKTEEFFSMKSNSPEAVLTRRRLARNCLPTQDRLEDGVFAQEINGLTDQRISNIIRWSVGVEISQRTVAYGWAKTRQRGKVASNSSGIKTWQRIVTNVRRWSCRGARRSFRAENRVRRK